MKGGEEGINCCCCRAEAGGERRNAKGGPIALPLTEEAEATGKTPDPRVGSGMEAEEVGGANEAVGSGCGWI